MSVKFIDSTDDVTLDAEQKTFRGGADEFSTATDLPDDTSGQLVNVIVQDNGRPRTRPGADNLGGAALGAGHGVDASVYFDTPLLEYIVASINGTLIRWNGTNWADLPGYFGPTIDDPGLGHVIEMCQGGDKLYLSDGAGPWYSHDGTAFSRPLPPAPAPPDKTTSSGDPPVGASIMCWHTQRMFANAPAAGASDQLVASFIGSAGEAQWDWVNFSFRVGRGEGQAITALCSAKGLGLMVGKESSIYVVMSDPTARTSVGDLSAAAWPIQRLSGEVGVTGKRAMCSAGSSVFVFCSDGLREIVPTQEVDTPYELQAPLSEPMQAYVDRVNWAAADRVVLHKYRHLLLCALPLDSATRPTHVLVLNLRTRRWMGVWTGWTPYQMISSRFGAQGERLIVTAPGQVNAWKDYASDTDLTTFKDNGVNIAAVARGKSWDFGSQRNWKDGTACEFQFLNSNCDARLFAVFDGVTARAWTVALRNVGLTLPFTLPATLGTLRTAPTRIALSLDDLPEFKEMYLEVTTPSGWVELKSLAAEAFVNTVDNE